MFVVFQPCPDADAVTISLQRPRYLAISSRADRVVFPTNGLTDRAPDLPLHRLCLPIDPVVYRAAGLSVPSLRLYAAIQLYDLLARPSTFK